MSINHLAYSRYSRSSFGNNITPLKIVSIPMSALANARAKGQLTVNLALFFLVLLVDEDRVIFSSYLLLDLKADLVRSTSKAAAKSILESKSTFKSVTLYPC
jgi:hypothetical protein